MPIDLSAFGESLQRGLGEIPPVAVALALLAGPDVAVYRCGVARDAGGELEVIVEQPTGPPASFDVPAGSPFAAIAANPRGIEGRGIGVPVMGDPAIATDAVAVGPGRPGDAVAVPVVADDEAPGEDSLEPVVERHR